MTKEKYERVVAINHRIIALQDAFKEITDPDCSIILGYLYKDANSRNQSYTLCPKCRMDAISDILKKHDIAIREEIQKEIESLTKEIEEL